MATEANLGTLEERAPVQAAAKAVFPILLGISLCHLLNDTVQSLIPAVYPLLRDALHLNLGQVGVIALTSQFTASILQPLVGHYTDRHPQPYILAVGMGVTILGLFSFAVAPTYGAVLGAAALVGIGSAIFHPESSRVARLASGGQHGMAQSLFQVGGNAGTSLGPLLAAFVLRNRQPRIAWFSLLALIAMMLLARIGSWVKTHHLDQPKSKSIDVDPAQLAATPHAAHNSPLSSKKIAISLAVLVALLFSKFFYLASLISYYTFYLMNRFHLSVQSAQLHLALFLGAVAVGTYFGGPVGDKLGRKLVIWWSILGVLPFTLILPYANLFWTSILSVIIGLILASAFSAILVYGQELMPGRIGMVSGLFFGLAFGLGGVGSAALGKLADHTSIDFVYHVCAYLPAIGILTAFLPDLGPAKVHQPKPAAA
ncbi:MAG TPA: MFS transporter [Candidatus Bathyarchaeia archaeon]|jgi:FSR family fosmidomycin resistance protein-like MFS transporter|nr:MFS transporter [Candidatus Bathyarchaeia archaeon]